MFVGSRVVLVSSNSARVLETADQALMGHIAYYYAIANYGQWGVLLKASMLWCVILSVLRTFSSLNIT